MGETQAKREEQSVCDCLEKDLISKRFFRLPKGHRPRTLGIFIFQNVMQRYTILTIFSICQIIIFLFCLMQEDSDSQRSDNEEGLCMSAQEQIDRFMSQFVNDPDWFFRHIDDFVKHFARMDKLYDKLSKEMDQWSFQKRLQYFKDRKIALQKVIFQYEKMARQGFKEAQDCLPKFHVILTNVGLMIQILELRIKIDELEKQQIARLIEVQKQTLHKIHEETRQVDQEIREMYQEMHDFQGGLRVILKIRPIQSQKATSEEEMEELRKKVMIQWKNKCQIQLNETIPGIISKEKWVAYRVDQAFSPDISQAKVFRSVAYLVHRMLKNEKCALLCFGQAASGKTYTMLGSLQCMELPFLTQNSGIVPRALQEAFEIIDNERKKGRNLHLSMYFREYCLDTSKKEGSKPKFSRPNLVITEEEPILLDDLKEALTVLGKRMKKRKGWRTEKDGVSSLSHMLICLQLSEGPEMQEIGQLCLIDLAGDDQMSKEHPQDSIYINSSLLELRECLKISKKNPKYVWRGNLIVDSLKMELEGRKTLLIVNLSSKKERQQQNKASMSFGLNFMNFSK